MSECYRIDSLKMFSSTKITWIYTKNPERIERLSLVWKKSLTKIALQSRSQVEAMGHVGSVDFFVMVILHFVMRERFVKEGSIKTPVLLHFISVKPQKRKKRNLSRINNQFSYFPVVSLISHFFFKISVHLLYIHFTQNVRDRRDRSEVRDVYHFDILICAYIFGMIEDCSEIFKQNGNWSLSDIIKMCCT